MPRKKLLMPSSAVEPTRRDTIGLRSIVKYDPRAPRPSTPVMVGPYLVGRQPLTNSIYTEYVILDGHEIVRTQISYPSEGDCHSAITRYRMGQTAWAPEATTKKTAKRRGRPPLREAA